MRRRCWGCRVRSELMPSVSPNLSCPVPSCPILSLGCDSFLICAQAIPRYLQWADTIEEWFGGSASLTDDPGPSPSPYYPDLLTLTSTFHNHPQP